MISIIIDLSNIYRSMDWFKEKNIEPAPEFKWKNINGFRWRFSRKPIHFRTASRHVAWYSPETLPETADCEACSERYTASNLLGLFQFPLSSPKIRAYHWRSVGSVRCTDISSHLMELLTAPHLGRRILMTGRYDKIWIDNDRYMIYG